MDLIPLPHANPLLPATLAPPFKPALCLQAPSLRANLWQTLPLAQQQEIVMTLAGMLHKHLHLRSEEGEHD